MVCKVCGNTNDLSRRHKSNCAFTVVLEKVVSLEQVLFIGNKGKIVRTATKKSDKKWV